MKYERYQFMPSCLITGFTPFLNHSYNPTEELAHYFDGMIIHNFKIKGLVLPVDFNQSWPILESTLTAKNFFDVILLNGLAENRKAISLEKFAYNSISNQHPDNQGVRIEGEIEEGEPLVHPTTLQDEVLQEVLNSLRTKGHLVDCSLDPGRYLCNFIYYKTLQNMAKKSMSTKCLFVHWPMVKEHSLNSTMTISDYIRFINDLLPLLSLK